MPDLPPPHKRLFGTPFDLVVLSIVAGSADAAGYLGLGRVFTANMTGNIVLLGIAVSEGRSGDTERSLFALLAFIVGTCLGGWMCRDVPPKRGWAPQITQVISLEAGLLLVYAAWWLHVAPVEHINFAYPYIALLGLAMGLQGAAAFHLGIPGVVTTVVTGTLTSLFTGLTKIASAAGMPQPDKPDARPPLLLQAIVVVTYCSGAAMSGMLMFHARQWVGFFPATIIVLVILTRVVRPK
jgi:uncharacterized membrane protein YoaK (UPF0700 family)